MANASTFTPRCRSPFSLHLFLILSILGFGCVFVCLYILLFFSPVSLVVTNEWWLGLVVTALVTSSSSLVSAEIELTAPA